MIEVLQIQIIVSMALSMALMRMRWQIPVSYARVHDTFIHQAVIQLLLLVRHIYSYAQSISAGSATE